MTVVTAVLPALSAFTLFWVAHVCLWRAGNRRKGIILLLQVAVIAYVISSTLSGGPFSHDVWISLPVFAVLVLAYLHFYVGTYRSLSVRILEELMRKGGSMTLQELDQAYPTRWMFTSRLEILESHHWIARESGRWRCTPKGRRFARLIKVSRRLYGIQNAG